MTDLDALPTPVLLLDLERLERNLARMAERCRTLGVTLRPHLKTHKCVEVAERQRAHGARGVTVATLHEARVFADHGFDDITWAFPLVLSRLDEARELASRVTLRVTIDSTAALDALERTGHPLHVWLKIDCGYHRAGLDPADPATLDLARRLAASPRLRFDGLLTHSGHAYHEPDPAARRGIADAERRAVAELRERLAAEGIHVRASVGSTPAMAVVESLAGVQEARPGNYVFHDGTQVALGTCAATDCAVTVLASVVSAPAGRTHCVTDAGALALSKDVGPSGGGTGMGQVYDDYAAGTLRASARLTALSQEHGMLSSRLPVGHRVRILPNHACLTVACFDEYAVVRGDRVVERWRIWRGR
ncbi:MAG: alanine racemase [Gemmatimonadota bacterium]|nr:alanine racemase [Gemmatimonadota bacterium]